VGLKMLKCCHVIRERLLALNSDSFLEKEKKKINVVIFYRCKGDKDNNNNRSISGAGQAT
jgi:hypothetical protein